MPVSAERNQYSRVLTAAVNRVTATYYYPGPAVGDPGIEHLGFNDSSWFISATNGAGSTQTFKVEVSYDGTTWNDVTMAVYNAVANTGPGVATFVAAAAVTTTFKLDLDTLNTRYIRLRNDIVEGGAGNAATVIFRDSGTT